MADFVSTVKVPSKKTLAKYGLSAEEWRAILASQGGSCAVCGLVPSTGRMVADHLHVKGWKKMAPEQRKLWVRGILCWNCNRYYLGRGITTARAKAVTAYLERFEARRPDRKETNGG